MFSVVSRRSDAVRSPHRSPVTHHTTAVRCAAGIRSGAATNHFVNLRSHRTDWRTWRGTTSYADDTQVCGSCRTLTSACSRCRSQTVWVSFICLFVRSFIFSKFDIHTYKNIWNEPRTEIRTYTTVFIYALRVFWISSAWCLLLTTMNEDSDSKCMLPVILHIIGYSAVGLFKCERLTVVVVM